MKRLVAVVLFVLFAANGPLRPSVKTPAKAGSHDLTPNLAPGQPSACTSATLEPSYVLKALGVGEDLAHTSIRFGLGRFNTEEEVDYVTDKMVTVVTKLRELSPLYEMAKEGIDISKVNWQTA